MPQRLLEGSFEVSAEPAQAVAELWMVSVSEWKMLVVVSCTHLAPFRTLEEVEHCLETTYVRMRESGRVDHRPGVKHEVVPDESGG